MRPASRMDLMKLCARIQWENVKHSAQDPARGSEGNGGLACRCAGAGVPSNQVSVMETPPSLVPSKNPPPAGSAAWAWAREHRRFLTVAGKLLGWGCGQPQ